MFDHNEIIITPEQLELMIAYRTNIKICANQRISDVKADLLMIIPVEEETNDFLYQSTVGKMVWIDEEGHIIHE